MMPFPEIHTERPGMGRRSTAGCRSGESGGWRVKGPCPGAGIRGVILAGLLALAGNCVAKPVLYLIGDSTVRNGTKGQQGWGDPLKDAFDGEKVTVENAAIGGRSSRTFLTEGRWDAVLAKLRKGDHVLMQFGHNDGGPINEGRCRASIKGNGEESVEIVRVNDGKAETVRSYGWYLRKYIREAREKGAVPVVVSPIPRNIWKEGRIGRDDAGYSLWAKQAAEQEGAGFVPFNTLLADRYEALGEAATGRLFAAGDHTHTGPEGAAFNAGVMAEALRGLEGAGLAGWLRPVEVRQGRKPGDYLTQSAGWFGSAEGKRVTARILSWQTVNGDWPKNHNTAGDFHEGKREDLTGTFDNGATTDELRYLAVAYRATRDEACREAFLRGLDHILGAQYGNGGWPQRAPAKGYQGHITFNDGTMVRLMDFLRETGREERYDFVDGGRREAARQAVEKGVACILKCQVAVNGKPAVWCAQHDAVTLAPAKARAYELPSLSGCESAGLLVFLMGLENPGPEVRRAVEGGLEWFEAAGIRGLRVDTADGDKKAVEDVSAPPLWARFYDLETGRPFFCGRDGVKKASLAEIDVERRNGYAWYGNWGEAVAKAGARWRADHPGKMRYCFGSEVAGFVKVGEDEIYTAGKGHGFEAVPVPGKARLFSVKVPEGDYLVTVELAGDGACTTVKAEQRRLVLENGRGHDGLDGKARFTVNVRNALLPSGKRVGLKPREISDETLNWDDKLTLEFNGANPEVRSVEITPVRVPVVYLTGDSTVCDQPREPWCSWGQMLPRFLTPAVVVANHAQSGESIGSSLGARRFDKVFSRMKPGDYLFIQFGHNDQKDSRPDAVAIYRQRLAGLVEQARSLGGTPVLVTPVERKAGVEKETLGAYPDTVREVARETGCALIDLNGLSRTLYQALGADLDKAFQDGTHHNGYGSRELAKCVVLGIRRAGLPLAEHLTGDSVNFDPARPDAPGDFAVPPSPGPEGGRPAGN